MMPYFLFSFRSMLVALLWGLSGLLTASFAASSIMIWSIDPIIESDQRASALWLENRGDHDALLQLRVFAWTQNGVEDLFSEQQEVIGSPPMLSIAPNAKQLVRLTRLAVPEAGSERAYRLVIDEIPIADTDSTDAGSAPKTIKFQMRYSIPLFVYGDGLWLKETANKKRSEPAGKPDLSWRIVSEGGGAFLEVKNTGAVHARLTEVAFVQGGQATSVTDGLLGYVLARSTTRWPLTAKAGQRATLRAVVNGAPSAQDIRSNS